MPEADGDKRDRLLQFLQSIVMSEDADSEEGTACGVCARVLNRWKLQSIIYEQGGTGDDNGQAESVCAEMYSTRSTQYAAVSVYHLRQNSLIVLGSGVVCVWGGRGQNCGLF